MVGADDDLDDVSAMLLFLNCILLLLLLLSYYISLGYTIMNLDVMPSVFIDTNELPVAMDSLASCEEIKNDHSGNVEAFHEYGGLQQQAAQLLT